MPHLKLNPEKYVESYQVAIDDGGFQHSYPPEADGSALIDLVGIADPGSHSLLVRACNASGCSEPLGPLPFSLSLPVPAVPEGEIVAD